jgi:Tfp pilus assembly protein PilW
MSSTKPNRSSQAGVTLVELMVTMLITSLVGAMIVAAYIVTSRSDRQASQDHQALATLRLSTDRIEGDLRQARRIYQDSTANRLHMWVDYDRDNQQDLSERITFEITTNSGLSPAVAGTTSTLRRKTDAPGTAPMLIADNMQLFPPANADRLTFQYLNAAGGTAFTPVAAPSSVWTDTTLVDVRLASDAAEGPYPAPRTLKTEVRLRNATTY